MPQNEVLLAKHGYGKQGSLQMVLVPQHKVGYFRDRASLVQGAVHIVDRNWVQQGSGGQPIGLDVAPVNEQTSCA